MYRFELPAAVLAAAAAICIPVRASETLVDTRCLISAAAGAPLLGPVERVDTADLAKKAALQAKERLGTTPAKAVIVYSFSIYPTAAVLKGVAEVFPAEIIHGSQTLGVITPDGGKNSIGVLAIGGEVEAIGASTSLAQGPERAAAGLAAALAAPLAKARAAGMGSLCLVFGQFGDGWADLLLAPLVKTLGAATPVWGTAGSGAVFHRGQAMERSVSILLLSGRFAFGHAMREDDGDVGQITATSASAMTTAAAGRTAPRLALVSNCVSRRNRLTVEQEGQSLLKAARGATLFGAYGKGEIGRDTLESVSRPVTRRIAITVVKDPEQPLPPPTK